MRTVFSSSVTQLSFSSCVSVLHTHERRGVNIRNALRTSETQRRTSFLKHDMCTHIVKPRPNVEAYQSNIMIALTLGVGYIFNAQALQTGTRLEDVALLDAARERNVTRIASRHHQRVVEEKETERLQVLVRAQLRADAVEWCFQARCVQMTQQVSVCFPQRLWRAVRNESTTLS